MKLFERDDYRHSFWDGMAAHVYGTLTSGVFLTGYALYLEMSELMIGLMMAIPAMVTLVQLPASYYICRRGRRKAVAFWAATIGRLLWLPVLAVGMVPFFGGAGRCGLILILYLVLQAFSSISYIAWISWTSDLVPDEIRGTFFGTRNMLCGAAGIATVLLFGWVVDSLRARLGPSGLVFVVPFACAVAFGMLSSHYLNRIRDAAAPPACDRGFFQQFAEPFRQSNFRRFLVFGGVWNFSVFLAAPFFPLYHLRELHYSYAFVALLATLCAVADLCAVRVWGSLCDKIKNKGVIQTAGWGVVFLPALWVMVRPEDVLLPLAMQIVGGSCWAGVALCTSTMLLRIAPQPNRMWFISAYSIAAGLGGAAAPIVGGLILNRLNSSAAGAAGGILPLHFLFIASTVLRMVSLFFFRTVHESQENSLRQTLAALRRMLGRRAPAARLYAHGARVVRLACKRIRAVVRPLAREQM